jgi:two-component system OmpR family response regulator
MNAHRILLVEDDPILGEGLSLSLKLEGYELEWMKTVATGLSSFDSFAPDLAVLDINLPDGSGLELCRSIRAQNSETAIIFLTAKTDEETVVKGLEEGANDFVKKPFSHKELMARIKSHLRRRTSPIKNLSIGSLVVNAERREVLHDGQDLGLNRRQFDILVYFLKHQDQIITRDQLLSHLDQENAIFDRTIDSHLSQLRKLLKSAHVDDVHIVSVYGVGYRLEIS